MCCAVADIILIMSLIQILQASILLWPCYRMVIMLALITIALCRILAYYPHYEPLWVINRYLHVCCRPLGDTNNNIDSTSSIVYAQNPDTLWAFDFIHSFYKETSICRLCVLDLLAYYPTNFQQCNALSQFAPRTFPHKHNFWFETLFNLFSVGKGMLLFYIISIFSKLKWFIW